MGRGGKGEGKDGVETVKSVVLDADGDRASPVRVVVVVVGGGRPGGRICFGH